MMILPDAHEQVRGRAWIAWPTLERVWLLGLVAAVLLLALVNLPYAPRTWFDEGSHLHVPKALVQRGVYADVSSEGYRYHGPTIGVGPTVMLPVALVFKIFGIGLLQGRLVIVAYLVAALVAFYMFARRMHGARVALLGLTLLLASRTFSYEGIVEYGRQVLGEVPGMAFLFLGALAWLVGLQAANRPQRSRVPALFAILAGLGFGLALVTKNQFVLIVPPVLVLLALLDWRYYRSGNWWLRIAPPVIACGCFGAWTLAQFQFFGPGTFYENMQQTRQAAGGAIFVFSLRSMLRAGYYLLRPDLYGGLLIPALVYALWRARRRDAQGLAEAFVALLIGCWLVWYVVVSLGWPRYAFPAVAFSALTVARALADLIGWLWRSERRGRAWLFAGYAGLAIAMSLVLTIGVIARPDASAQRFAAFLDANVPRDAIVETWDPELGLLTDHRYHYPPQPLLDAAVRREWLGGPAPVYDWQSEQPPYVVVGPFGSYTEVYQAADLARAYEELHRDGAYVLFKRKS